MLASARIDAYTVAITIFRSGGQRPAEFMPVGKTPQDVEACAVWVATRCCSLAHSDESGQR
jgi:hypothetical protein